MSDFQYEIAFSFLADDETLAAQLAELLTPAATFVYSERQLDLAGNDGVDSFSEVFRRNSRTVAVLYRSGWGKTKWTRIEEEAIKSRFLDDGANFLTLLQLDKSAVPAWFPSTRIWFDFERFGVQGAASVLKERISQAGAALRAETPQENAARLERELQFQSTRRAFLHSEEGVGSALAAVDALFLTLERLAADVQVEFARERHYAQLYLSGISVNVAWRYHARNSLRDASLIVEEWQGRPDIGDRRFYSPQKSSLERSDFTFDMTPDGSHVWQKGEETLTTERLAERCVHQLFERVRKKLRERK